MWGIFLLHSVVCQHKKYKFGFITRFMKQAGITYLYTVSLLLVLISCRQQPVQDNIATKKAPAITQTDSLTNKGNEQWRMGNYQEALNYFTRAYTRVKQTGDEQQMATLLNNLGLVHWRLENNSAAMECYNEAAKLAEKLDMKRLLGLTCTNRALILKEQRDFKAAFSFNNRAIALFKELAEPRDLAIAYNNQGQIYRFSEQPDDALKYYLLSLEECKNINYSEGMATAYQNLSTVYTAKGDGNRAFEYAHKCLGLSLKGNSKVRTSEAYLELSRIHDKFADPDSALYYYKKHYERERELMEANQSDLLSRYQANLGMEVKNLRIKNLQNEKQIANNRLWLIVLGIFIALLTVAFFVYRYLSAIKFNKRQLEQELQNSRKLIEVKEQELKTYIIDLSRKNAIISSLTEVAMPEPADPDVAELLSQKILTDDDWEKFKGRFHAIYPKFFQRIKESRLPLTEAEIRILVLMRLELTGKDMANILGISPQSVRVCKMRLKKKLPAEKYETVEDFLLHIVR